MKILFFIGNLSSGGKERRLVELLYFLKTHTDFNLLLVVRRDMIDYPLFHDIKINYKILTENYRRGDKTLHFRFLNICKEFKPDIIHTWGSMPAFVSLLAVILMKIPHINSQITDTPPKIKTWSIQNIICKINFHFSTIILANSHAGLKAYKQVNFKGKVICNGVNLDRFNNLPDGGIIRQKYSIRAAYCVIMVASFTKNKNYDKFLDIAKEIKSLRNDVTFVAVGDGSNLERIKNRVLNEAITNVQFTGKINDVESLVSIADICLLFSPNGEGMSNSILEYMALQKPVIANDAGGTKELVQHNVNGYLINTESAGEIAELIDNLLDQKQKRENLGMEGRKRILESFTIDIMGEEFVELYKSLLREPVCKSF